MDGKEVLMFVGYFTSKCQMGLIDIIEPPSTLGVLLTTSKRLFGNVENRTQGRWMRSKYAIFVLCILPPIA